MPLREAMLYKRENENVNAKVRCNVCAHQCLIPEDGFGICRTRQNRAGKLYTLIYAEASSFNADPVEKKPLYHFYPGSYVFSLGTISCNFHCKHCQNWSISTARPGDIQTFTISPEEAVRRAKQAHCNGIAWTYNEPTIWFEYTYDCAKLAKAEGLYTVYVTNGYISEEALNEIAPFLDAVNVDVKAFSDSFYKRVCGARLEPVLETCKRVLDKQIHLELTYLIIPGYNDTREEIRQFADWVARLSTAIPLHFSRFYPAHLMLDVPPTRTETLEMAHELAKDAGIEYVYLGNIPGHQYENTYCPGCGELLILRMDYRVKRRIRSPRCPACGRDINIIL